MKHRAAGLCLAFLFGAGVAFAHEGDSEDRAIRVYALLGQMDQQIALAAKETDPQKIKSALAAHRQLFREALQLLREAADRSPCVMLESHREEQKMACLIDTEARLRFSDRLLEQMLQRDSIER